MNVQYDNIDNISLTENGLLHIEFELEREKPSFFRIARESHQVLYRSMVEALDCGDKFAITGCSNKKEIHRYKIGSQPWKEETPEKVKGCVKAWRYSSPINCDPPKTESNDEYEIKLEYFLERFFTLLARIQSEGFMRRFVNSKQICVSDENMKLLENLHIQIRNNYEHFYPCHSSCLITDLIQMSYCALRLSRRVLFESGNVLHIDGHFDKIGLKLEVILKKLNRINK